MKSRLFLPMLFLVFVSTPGLVAAENDDSKAGVAKQKEDGVLSFLRIAEIGTEKVDILFTGFLVLPGGDPEKPESEFWLISIFWETEKMAKRVPYGAAVHGFKLFPLEKTVQKRWNPRLRKFQTFERWILTLSKDGKEVARLRRGDQIQIDEPYAVLEVKTGEDKWEKTEKLFVDSKFKAGNQDLKVTGIGEDSVTIEGKDGKKIVLKKQ